MLGHPAQLGEESFQGRVQYGQVESLLSTDTSVANSVAVRSPVPNADNPATGAGENNTETRGGEQPRCGYGGGEDHGQLQQLDEDCQAVQEIN